MFLASAALALQMIVASYSAPTLQRASAAAPADSLRSLKRAYSAQGSFERARRSSLPRRSGSDGSCDVRLGRFCWWYDEIPPNLPPEPASIARHRAQLIGTLDSLAALHPGDDWIAGMRVHYRIDGRFPAAADSVARTCGATPWWCLALTGYANHLWGAPAAAESAFDRALAAMPEPDRCRWRDISVLLPGSTRSRYSKLSCAARRWLEERYWQLSRPQLAADANEWRTEFYVRRVQARLAERAVSPQPGSWGSDAAELVLRYGWPVAWSRVDNVHSGIGAEVRVVGHDPVPSFNFAPVESLLDSLATAGDDGWDHRARLASSRFAPRLVRRIAPLEMQLARFRRGDSTLLAAAFSAADDSLGRLARAFIGASLPDGTTRFAAAGSRAGSGTLLLGDWPTLAGVEIVDTATYTLARSRVLLPLPLTPAPSGLALSDLLLYRARSDPPASLDAALALAIAGDTVSRARAVGIFWETYGVSRAGEHLDVAVTVQRVDRSWMRGARQRMRLAAPDTPVRIRWSDARPAAAGAPLSRAISLDLANLTAGQYRITVKLTRPDGSATETFREIQLRER